MKSFKRFKRKLLIETLLKSIILGFSLACLSAAVLYHFTSLLITIISSLSILIISSLIVFLITKPNDMQVAKRLDNQLGLHEKIQTMIAFKDKNSSMFYLQREDANKDLDSTPTKNLSMKFSFVTFMVAIVAAMCLGGSTVIPEKKPIHDTPIVEVGGIDYTDKINQIKDWLNNKDIDEELKAKLEEALQKIQEILDSLQMTDAQKVEAIDKLLAEIRDELNINYSKEIGFCLMKFERLYKFGFSIYNQDQELLNVAMQEMMNDIGDSMSTCYSYIKDIEAALSDAVNNYHVDRNDKMYKLVEGLMKSLYAIYNEAELNGAPQLPEKLVEDVFYESTIKITDVQKVEIAIGEFTDFINDITAGLEPEESAGDGELPPDEEEYVYQPISGDDGDESFEKEFIIGSAKEDATGGYGAGIGMGDITVAKNERVYDPITNSFVSYGDIIKADGYYATYILNGLTDGNMPEDIESFIYQYYMQLYYGKAE